MSLLNNFIYLNFLIDSNYINSKQAISALNYLEKLNNKGVISIISTETVNVEVSSYLPSRKKSNKLIYSKNMCLTAEENNIKKKIEFILFPNGIKNDNQKNDVDIVFNAWKYGKILITHDGDSKNQPGGILGNREMLKKELDIKVMTAKMAAEHAKNKIKERELMANKIAEMDN